MNRTIHQHRRQRIAIHISIIAQHAWRRHVQRHILVGDVTVIPCDRRIVHRCHRDGHRCRCGKSAIGDRVGEGIRSIVVGVRRVGHRYAIIDHRAMDRRSHGGDRQRITIHIRIIAEHIDGRRHVFQRRGDIVRSHRCVVHRIHGNRHRGDIGVRSTVVGLVGERIRAVEIGIRRVGKRAVGIQRQRAMSRIAHQHRRQRITVGIGIVEQHARRSHAQAHILIDGVAVIHRHRRLVGRTTDQCQGMKASASNGNNICQPTHLHRRAAIGRGTVAKLAIIIIAPGPNRAIGFQR